MAGLTRPRKLDKHDSRAEGDHGTTAKAPVVEDLEGAHDHHFQAPFHRSIRFRLTAWYATALILVIIALSFALHTLLVRTLTNEVESRLLNAVREIAPGIELAAPDPDPDAPPRTIDDLVLEPPSYDSVLLSGLWFQIFGRDQQPHHVDSAGALSEAPADLVAALADSDAFSVERRTYKTITVGGEETLVLVAPLSLRVGETQRVIIGWVVVGEPLGFRNAIIGVVGQVLRLFGVVGVVLAVGGGWLIAGRALSPVGRITRTAGTIANSEGAVSLSKRLDVPNTGDELSRLAHTFNTMLERIEMAFNAQRRFVSDASHELRTPLTSVRGNVDVLVRQLTSDRPIETDEIVQELHVIKRESSRMSRLIEDMLVLARSDSPNRGDFLRVRAVSLTSLAEEAFRTAHQFGNGQDLKLTAGGSVSLNGDADRLIQVMIILLDNAIRHTPTAGTVEMIVDKAVDATSRGLCARIRVRDTGSGISAEHVPHLFERFYRVEDARSRASGGTGLGLAIALTIVRGHRGWIDVDTVLNKGTTFSVWLPLEPVVEPVAMAPPGDDDSLLHTARRRYLRLREGASRGR